MSRRHLVMLLAARGDLGRLVPLHQGRRPRLRAATLVIGARCCSAALRSLPIAARDDGGLVGAAAPRWRAARDLRARQRRDPVQADRLGRDAHRLRPGGDVQAAVPIFTVAARDHVRPEQRVDAARGSPASSSASSASALLVGVAAEGGDARRGARGRRAPPSATRRRRSTASARLAHAAAARDRVRHDASPRARPVAPFGLLQLPDTAPGWKPVALARRARRRSAPASRTSSTSRSSLGAGRAQAILVTYLCRRSRSSTAPSDPRRAAVDRDASAASR